MEETQKVNTTNKYIFYFFIYSFLGWLLETLYAYIVLGYFNNRGFLIGPICPIYGFGMLILIVALSRYKKQNVKLFFIASIVLTYFEYITGFVLDAIFNLKWWDYSNTLFNINGRICLNFAFIWGIIAIIVVNYIHPLIEKISNKFFKKLTPIMLDSIIKVFVMVWIIDLTLSSISYLN